MPDNGHFDHFSKFCFFSNVDSFFNPCYAWNKSMVTLVVDIINTSKTMIDDFFPIILNTLKLTLKIDLALVEIMFNLENLYTAFAALSPCNLFL